MAVLIYILSGLSILLAIGGLATYRQTKHIGLLLSSLVSVSCSIVAISLIEWWPLVVSFGLNWILRLLGLDPSRR